MKWAKLTLRRVRHFAKIAAYRGFPVMCAMNLYPVEKTESGGPTLFSGENHSITTVQLVILILSHGQAAL